MALSKFLLALLVAALLVPAAAISQHGHEVQCIGGRAHLLHYDVAGPATDSELHLSSLEHAVLLLEPAPQHDTSCGLALGAAADGREGDKRLCVGANQDTSCSGAKSSLPLKGGLTCEGCFVGATADLYYKLNYTALNLNSVEIGLRDMHLRSRASVDFDKMPAQTPVSGSKVLENATVTVIDRLVGCPVCIRVKITVNVPASLDYNVHLDGSVHATAGGELDIHLGDQGMMWEKETGWQQVRTQNSVTANPILSDDAHGQATAGLTFESGVVLTLDDIASFTISLKSSAELTATAKGSWTHKRPEGQVCLEGDADLAVTHEADLHWEKFKEFHHWGPKSDFSWSKKNGFHKCIGAPSLSDVLVV